MDRTGWNVYQGKDAGMPESRTQSAVRVKKILTDVESIAQAGKTMSVVPGPRPESR